MADQDERLDVLRMALEPGDAIVITTPHSLSLETAERIRTSALACLPGHAVIVLGGGLQVSTIGRDDRMQRIEETLGDMMTILNTLVQALGEDDEEPPERTLDGAVVAGERDQSQSLG